MGGNEQRYVEEAFLSNYVAPTGSMVDGFERAFSAYTGIEHCVAVTSGTAAIHLALRCLGVGAGDSVIASSLTFIGSVAPILYQGATPILIDSDEATWNMDTQLLAETLADLKRRNQLPKAVLPTDIYGQSCDMGTIRQICDDFHVPLVVDAAESVGATYQGKHAGMLADAAAFSFNGNKIITTSGGGMLASHNKRLIDKARFLSQQARDPAIHYEHSTYGYHYRMSNIVAAIGCGQMEVLEARVARRREIFDHYVKALGDLPGIRFMPEAPYGKSNRWLTVMLIDAAQFGCGRETVLFALEEKNIEARPVWKPMHMQPVFKDVRVVGGDVSAQFFNDGICLPSGTQMTEADLARVCDTIRACQKIT
jgi:dTDP-4-amino-4,6-dideoxygalactose transaminase